MIPWSDDIDPQTIPDPVLYAEAKRRPKDGCKCGWVSEQTSRASLARKTFGAGPGRPKMLARCNVCGRELGVAEMRAHRHPQNKY